jgi:hypothetical protein
MNWDDLRGELDLWAEEARSVSLWWRDDDAAEPVPALYRLLDLADRSATGIALAVVPAAADETLARAVNGYRHAAIVQHGFRHRDHAAPGERAVECGGDRPVADVLSEIRTGYRRLADLFGPRFLPILAPPWNRIDRAVVPRLPELGFRGLSTFGARETREPLPGLVTANAHVDPLNWRGPVRFAGLDKVLGNILGELRARRLGEMDAAEPLGLLTHHRDHDTDAWVFIEAFLRVTKAHPAVHWLRVETAFGLEPAMAGKRR